jgi:hypothetical protein
MKDIGRSSIAYRNSLIQLVQVWHSLALTFRWGNPNLNSFKGSGWLIADGKSVADAYWTKDIAQYAQAKSQRSFVYILTGEKSLHIRIGAKQPSRPQNTVVPCHSHANACPVRLGCVLVSQVRHDLGEPEEATVLVI